MSNNDQPLKQQAIPAVSHTAFYIFSSADNQKAADDLKQLVNLSLKSNPVYRVYAKVSDRIKIEKMGGVGEHVVFIENEQFPETVNNVLPLSLPLINEPQTYVKWLNTASKAQKNDTVLLGNGKVNAKAGYVEKWSGYWANFWPKLMTGSNVSLAGTEAVLLTPAIYHQLKLNNAWQIAAIAEKDKKAQAVDFDMAVGSFVFGDGIKAFFTGIFKGLKAIKHSFLGLKSTLPVTTTWASFSHPGYKRLFGITAAVLLALMCFISFDYNVTWDEPNHNAYSKDVLKYYSSFGTDTTMFDFQKPGHRDYFTNNFYGMSIDVISSAVNSVLDIKNEYATRHLINAIVGFLCILFTALIVRIFAGWLPALVTLLAMVCSPSFFGHCFNNPKDIPFATGYIMAVYYLIKLLYELPAARHQTKVMLAVAIGFAISIRVQGVLPIIYLGMVFLGYFIIAPSKNKKQQLINLAGIGAGVAIAGYFLGIILWPYALRHPLTAPFKALSEFSNFSYLTYYELFEGVRIFNKPWYYEPKLIMLTAPLMVLVGFGLSLLLGWWKKDKVSFLALLLLIVATFFPSMYTIYKKSYVYNGWRHFLFIYPSLMAMAILGWVWLVQWFKSEKFQMMILVVAAITLIKPAVWSVANHPYQYMYFNEIAGGVKGANGVYELDYWQQTPREAFAWLVKNHPEILKGDKRVSSNNIQEALKSFVPEGKDVMYKWTREYEWADDDWSYAIWTSRTLSKNQILDGYWPPKGTIHEIKVDGVTVAAVVKSANNYGHRGKQYLKKSNFDSALYFYEKAVAYNPMEEEYVRGLAEACKMLKRNDSAIRYYTKAMELRSGNYEAMAAIAELYLNTAIGSGGEPDKQMIEKAKSFFEQTIIYKKNFAAPYYYLGEIYSNEKNYEKSLSYFADFFEEGQANQQVYGRMTDLLKTLGYSGEEAEPYYYLHTRALERGDKHKAETYLNYHNEMMSGAK
ncbi:MAG: hypothetical protein V4613_03290 [Bacteroidota bacterium]